MKILQNATEEELITAITTNEIESWQKMYPEVPVPYDLFGVTGVITGVPYMMMQPLWNGDPRMTHVDAKDVIDWYKEHTLPMMWYITPDNPADKLPGILLDLNLEEASMKVPGMAVDLNALDKARLANLGGKFELHNLSSAKTGEVTEVLMQAFEIEDHPKIREGMADFFQRMLAYKPSCHVVCTIDGVIVGCASLIYAAGVAGVYNVAVLPGFRRRGIATAMMAYLMQDAIDRDYQYSILHATEKGKHVYEQLGYRSKFVYRRFLLRPSAVGFELG